MKTLADIRSTFLDFFQEQGHTVVESSPLVPRNDPTLMFTNSGMVQFKNVFTGAEKRPYTRATSAQKSVRAGGKHNDLENVGYTARHHTFFEMLGNFSFGDYFKDDAIYFAWTLVSKYFDLPKDKLLVTVYHDDEEAIRIWKKVAGFSDDKIIRIPTSDNFWRMGDTGPCGPCSEIFIDQGDKLQGGPPGSPDEDGDRFLEFWNLVFMQYEEQPGGQRVALPRPSIDTGMGLERIAAILQGKTSNYDIDLFRALIETTASMVKVDPDGAQKASFRVIADHLRASAFLIADGVMPSNEGRGYVLRRIMRRGMRHAHMLGAKEPLIHRLVPELVKQMGAAYPELVRAEAMVAETLKLEETRFKQTLDRGIKLLDDETAKLGEGQNLPGDVAFKLYDTFGFPLDLTQDVLRGQGKKVDVDGFDAAMARQKAAAREAWAGSGDAATEKVWFDLRDSCGATDFLGYATESAEGEVLAIVTNGQIVQTAKAGDTVALVFNQTPFYGESGGQAGDIGVLETASGAKVAVTDTQKKLGALHVHLGRVEQGEIRVHDQASLCVDAAHRADLRANHSATHLLHAALRRRLGENATQKGSLVTADRLRFDFGYPTALTAEDVAVIEAEVNARIRANSDITTQLLSPQDAMDKGAMALFGEKYGEEVRVVSMGGPRVEASTHDINAPLYSVELCGGTHARRTGDIGFFKIVGESAIAANVRRIEAVTGRGALAYVTTRDKALAELSSLLSVAAEETPQRLTTLMTERRKLERDVADLRRQLALAGGGTSTGDADTRDVAGVKFMARVMDNLPAKDLRGLADEFRKKIGSGVIALIAINEGKAALLVAVTPDLTTRFNAVDLLKPGVEALGGTGGGGRPDMAQAGGPNTTNAQDALAAIESKMKAG